MINDINYTSFHVIAGVYITPSLERLLECQTKLCKKSFEIDKKDNQYIQLLMKSI